MSERDPNYYAKLEEIQEIIHEEIDLLNEDIAHLQKILNIYQSLSPTIIFDTASIEITSKKIQENSKSTKDYPQLTTLLQNLYQYLVQEQNFRWETFASEAKIVITWLHKTCSFFHHEYYLSFEMEKQYYLLQIYDGFWNISIQNELSQQQQSEINTLKSLHIQNMQKVNIYHQSNHEFLIKKEQESKQLIRQTYIKKVGSNQQEEKINRWRELNDKLEKLKEIRDAEETYRNVKFFAFCISVFYLIFFFSILTTNVFTKEVTIEESYVVDKEIETYVCYTTATGECYHSRTCQYIAYSAYKTTVYSAKLRGYRSCSRCSPRETTTIIVQETLTRPITKQETNYFASIALSLCISVAIYNLIVLIPRKQYKDFEQNAQKTTKELLQDIKDNIS